MLLLAIMLATPGDVPRPTDADYRTSQTLIEVQTCVTRLLIRFGAVTPIPLENGAALDWQPKVTVFGGPGKAPVTIEIRDLGDERSVKVAYRHPFSAKAATNLLKDAAKRCGFLPPT